MPDYESLIDRERTPDGRFVVDVPDGTPTTDVACLTYPVLLERDQDDLAVDGLLRGAMTGFGASGPIGMNAQTRMSHAPDTRIAPR